MFAVGDVGAVWLQFLVALVIIWRSIYLLDWGMDGMAPLMEITAQTGPDVG